MRIDKLEQMVYALDLVIDRYNDREMNPKTLNSLLDEIYSFYHDVLQPYCGHSMSTVIIRNELIANLGEVQADCLYNRLF